MTRKEIEKALPFWMNVLNIENWEVTVRTGRTSELVYDGDPCDGLTYIHPEYSSAEIILKRGSKEDTLIHELLHIVFDGDKQLGPYDLLHERALNKTSQALLFLKTRHQDP